jgi:hypothetical protein
MGDGHADFDPNNRANWDPDLYIKKSPLWPTAVTAFDLALSVRPLQCRSEGVKRPRVRSMSMNLYLGAWGGTNGGYEILNSLKIFMKLSDINDPPPSKTFVFLDMREDSIDMGNFAVSMEGFPRETSKFRFWDLPGFYHGQACGFSFADNHAEIKRWQDPRTMPPLQRDGLIMDWLDSPDNRDIAWMQDRATRPR